MNYHPIANLFPMMNEQEYKVLREDLHKNGFRPENPIIIINDMILDGRNRYKAAIEENITPIFKKYIGESTNNQAEYQALILGLEEAIKAKAEEVDCYLDSELVVKQLNHEYKVKNAGLASLFVKVHNLSQQFKKIKFIHVFRESNVEADKLVNEAIDKALKK